MMRPYVVAAEVEAQDDLRAHALLHLGEVATAPGVALCGVPADYLTVVPGLAWEDVALPCGAITASGRRRLQRARRRCRS